MAAIDPRAEETRRRLVATGVELFARHGFDAVTTRQLAEAAGVNQAAIPYHFGGKEGVYRAVAEHVAAVAGERVRRLDASVRERLAAAPAGTGANIAELLREATAEIARIVLEPAHRGIWPMFLGREPPGSSAAFDRLYAEFAGPLHVLAGDLIARLTGTAADSEANILLTHAYLGQILAFATAQGTLNRRLGRRGDDGAEDAETAEAAVAAIERFSAMAVAGMRLSSGRRAQSSV